MTSIGVIGGSGLYDMPDIQNKRAITVDTPFGKPSGDIVLGTVNGKEVAFLPRHGVGHVYTPSEVPYRANIYALKSIGVRFIISVNACGSLREDYAPGHIVIPDQIIDYTIGQRPRSFFGNGIVAHVGVAEPFCSKLSALLYQAVIAIGGVAHPKGTFLIEDGPRFATKAESHLFRQWGCDIIGMTTAPEAFLAREAEIAYATMAHITDYDVWHESEAPVSVEMVVATFQKNIRLAQQAIVHTIQLLDENMDCACHTALDGAIMTNPEQITAQIYEPLRPILARALKR